MGKVEPVGIYDNIYVNTADGFSATYDGTDYDQGISMLAVKLNELIAAHNEHIETCEAGMHMWHQNQPQRIDVEAISKGS